MFMANFTVLKVIFTVFYREIFSKIVMDTWERNIRVISAIKDMQTSLVTASRP